MNRDLAVVLGQLRTELEAVADPGDARSMAAYMKDHFLFLGVKTPARRAVAKPVLAAFADAGSAELLDFADRCWGQPEREFQYVGTDLLRKHARRLEPDCLPHVEYLITTRSWWDTVDGLAAWVVGPLVRSNHELVAVMDDWIDSDDLWLARTAILHQLGFKEATDGERLFRYCERRASDREFFIRKAIGWALRQHARIDPDGVRWFVDEHPELSPLSRREALKHLGG